jgi:hypothetical protein
MAKPSVLDRIKELDAEKARLMDEAKSTALANAQAAIADLNELGFNYRLTEGGTTTVRAPRATGTRRAGIRDEVLTAVKNAGTDGISRATLLEQFNAKGDKSAEQSISNALSALKKAGTIDAKDGNYITA